MTEASPQVETIDSDLKTVENVEDPESASQEVHVNNLSDKCGGVSNQPPEKDNSEILQDEDCNGDVGGNGKKGKGKNVKFPDSGYVASYDEPKDPWKNAEFWTTEELVQAYKKSCEKHGVKPLIRLVQQLQLIVEICIFKSKYLCCIVGEKLDQKQCECLEEVFRRVQFKIVDLEASHLDDETPCLTALDMRNCDLNERSIPIMGRALKLGSHLTILHLENIYLSGRPLVILVAALKMNENLLELFLADNKLMPSDGIQLGILLKYNHKLELLDLRNNHLQDVGTRHVCDGLSEQTLERGLLTLVLWNNQITYQGMTPIANCLATVRFLETLNLGHNNITNEGIHQLKEGLLKNRSLLRLGLQGTKLSCEGAVALAEYVAESTKLLRLDLRENDIKTAGLMGLSLALTVNETVTRIDLDKDTKKEAVSWKFYGDHK
ncbi:hypothetical protein LOTGIDRAFT_107752 [Lottia gigantea]|uniref:Uncharacterized protein n=1 Tax=Lottia gigantea TaxID=225164 RepID=V3ZXJ9_LOTGI|nr:hypothetical protein LOTGIDRAFT_107752 [Lottia gigantea]ESO85706.1 hypothetical protein LOTGIDRAFT_107752 [Lottia gigantea]